MYGTFSNANRARGVLQVSIAATPNLSQRVTSMTRFITSFDNDASVIKKDVEKLSRVKEGKMVRNREGKREKQIKIAVET